MNGKKLFAIAVIASLTATAYCFGRDFNDDLVRSGYVHFPLPLDRDNSLEANAARKKVIAETRPDISSGWHHEGFGSIAVDADSARVVIRHPTSTGRRARGPANDPDYATYGNAVARFDMHGADMEKFNRVAFRVKPMCDGMRAISLNFLMENGGAPKKGYNLPTGWHQINLENNRWNECYLEIGDLQRDKVDRLSFSATLNGRDMTTGDTAVYLIDNIRFQTVEQPDKITGWLPDDGKIIYSMTGYSADGRKTAIVSKSIAERFKNFAVVDTEGDTVFSGAVRPVTTSIGSYGQIDFTEVKTPGEYILVAGDRTTRPFTVGGDSLWDDSQWRVVNYIFGQRCGYHVPGIHGKCHTDLFAVHDGVRIPYSGGWHDAGDLSQQTLQTADVAFALLEASQRADGHNPLLAARLREEALWGLDFVLRCRFGDGYHASSMGLLIWQDGKTDSFDDITTVRVQNVPLDNYLYAGYEAYAAGVLDDRELCGYLTRVAKEDFDFAEKEFEKRGPGGFISPMEHTFNTSMSQYMATISWAASRLYALTGERRYADRAADAIGYVIKCQQAEPIDADAPVSGFFYRDVDRKSLVHFIHQSREQIYMQALEAVIATQPDHPDRPRWENAVKLYGDYIKYLMSFTAPYGMIPSGIYRDDEYLDTDGFNALHIFAPENAAELFAEQLRQGERVSDRFYVKRFPVWFNIYNGNTAIHTSMGKSAAIAGKLLNDQALLDIAREQLYWTVGKNPFAQSLIYGEGHDYPMMNSFSSGQITGEMPVGIRTIGNTDQPYWPQINNACYKEVWVTSAGKWLSLISEL